MDRLDAMQLFVRVVQTGSFSATARATGIVQSTVSKQIAALEAQLGTQLIRRTSRGLTPTDAGHDFYESAVRLLADLEAAESRIGHGQHSPTGLVHVAMPSVFFRMRVVDRLPEFFERYPEMVVDVDTSEHRGRVVEDGVDIAIRLGQLADSSQLSRRIGTIEPVTVASPAYIERYGEPTSPEALANHPCVVLMVNGAPLTWPFRGPAGPIMIEPKGPLRTNDGEHIRVAALAGIGIALGTSWMFAADIAAGAVQPVLKDFAPHRYPITAVYPGGRRMSNKVRVFSEFLARICAEDPDLAVR